MNHYQTESRNVRFFAKNFAIFEKQDHLIMNFGGLAMTYKNVFKIILKISLVKSTSFYAQTKIICQDLLILQPYAKRVSYHTTW